ncbi:MAG: hypothetical protein A2092_18515 [Rhodobacteraceae bacterium GWE1_64_9]|nr:MAG: hypothetical protein A2092_18515 [Rhodobacteraceae bacterium GWE1_64_9]HBU15291.1 hypothetical protein [Gemmobacter sp.]
MRRSGLATAAPAAGRKGRFPGARGCFRPVDSVFSARNMPGSGPRKAPAHPSNALIRAAQADFCPEMHIPQDVLPAPVFHGTIP